VPPAHKQNSKLSTPLLRPQLLSTSPISLLEPLLRRLVLPSEHKMHQMVLAPRPLPSTRYFRRTSREGMRTLSLQRFRAAHSPKPHASTPAENLVSALQRQAPFFPS